MAATMSDKYRVEHTRSCPDRNGCPFDARPCACWQEGCRIVRGAHSERCIGDHDDVSGACLTRAEDDDEDTQKRNGI